MRQRHPKTFRRGVRSGVERHVATACFGKGCEPLPNLSDGLPREPERLENAPVQIIQGEHFACCARSLAFSVCARRNVCRYVGRKVLFLNAKGMREPRELRWRHDNVQQREELANSIHWDTWVTIANQAGHCALQVCSKHGGVAAVFPCVHVRTKTRARAAVHTSSHVKRGKDTHGTTGPESGTRGMRGSKPAGFTGVGERAARSLDRVSRRRGPRRAAGASLEQRDLLDDVCRVREHSRGHDAGEVVGEVVRRVEAAVGGAVAPALPA